MTGCCESMKEAPLVSIKCTVYNHEPFLRQCLDGFVMQQTTFPFEAIVHDDASTDGSADIIREYAEKYPDIIKPIYETENLYSKPGASIIRIIDAAMHPASKYIALCEGDDYWTDPHKLQLQVDFLESHPDYFSTCHAFAIYYDERKEFEPYRFVDELPLSVFQGREYCTPTLDNYFFSPWFTLTLTIVHRRKEYLEATKRRQFPCAYDYIVYYYLMKAGKCALFKDVMGVYRRHGGGIFTGRNDIKWNEVALENYYTLYQLENDERAWKMSCIYYDRMFKSYVKSKSYKKLTSLVRKHFSIVPKMEFIIGTSRNIVKLLLGMK